MPSDKLDRLIEEVFRTESHRIKDVDDADDIGVSDFNETMKKFRKRLELDPNSQQSEVMPGKENYK